MKIVLIFPRASPRRGTKVKNYMLPPHGLQLLGAHISATQDVLKCHLFILMISKGDEYPCTFTL
jgi:hypothetical protein